MIAPCDFAAIEREERPQAARLAMFLKGQLLGEEEVLDVGCATGLYVEEMRRVGIRAFGVDNDPRLIESAWLQRADVTHDLPRLATTVLSLEVGEHLSAEHAHDYILYLTRTKARTIYFSAARPGQGGDGHINCQQKTYWIRLLHFTGYYVDPELTDAWLSWMRVGPHMGWLTQNGIVFQRAI